MKICSGPYLMAENEWVSLGWKKNLITYRDCNPILWTLRGPTCEDLRGPLLEYVPLLGPPHNGWVMGGRWIIFETDIHPIPCMYGIFAYIWLIFMVNVANIPCMDAMGMKWRTTLPGKRSHIPPKRVSAGTSSTQKCWLRKGDVLVPRKLVEGVI